eukprot:1141055-Pelagomonas_calceolata.AAC.6
MTWITCKVHWKHSLHLLDVLNALVGCTECTCKMHFVCFIHSLDALHTLANCGECMNALVEHTGCTRWMWLLWPTLYGTRGKAMNETAVVLTHTAWLNRREKPCWARYGSKGKGCAAVPSFNGSSAGGMVWKAKERITQLYLTMAAQLADHEGTGRLSYSDFKELLKTSGLGLTRKDINLILSQVRALDKSESAVQGCRLAMKQTSRRRISLRIQTFYNGTIGVSP